MVGVVEVVDKKKTAAGVFAIAGLVGRQRSVKLREGNSPSTTRSKSAILRGDSLGSEESMKGKRRSFSVMHNSMDAKH